MVEQNRIPKLLDLTRKIAQNYLENNKISHIKPVKEKVKDLLTNPLWNDKSIFLLKQLIDEKDLSQKEFDSLWNDIEEIFDNYYQDYLKKKTYIFQGKIRQYEKRLLDFFVKAGKLKSQNYVLASIIGCLLIHKSTPLTQAQIKELTGLSKGGISTNLKLLEMTPIIKKELIKGSRKYSYSFGGDLSEIASNTGLYKYETNEIVKNFLNAKALELENFKDKNGYKILSQRIKDINDNFLMIHRKLIKFIIESDFIKSLEGYDS